MQSQNKACKELEQADISIINTGAFRTDINEGNITYQEIIYAMPHSDDIVVKKSPIKLTKV